MPLFHVRSSNISEGRVPDDAMTSNRGQDGMTCVNVKVPTASVFASSWQYSYRAHRTKGRGAQGDKKSKEYKQIQKRTEPPDRHTSSDSANKLNTGAPFALATVFAVPPADPTGRRG